MFEFYVVFYKPPCGKWYVHSHKLYPSISDAKAAVKKFLPKGTEYAIQLGKADWLDANIEVVCD